MHKILNLMKKWPCHRIPERCLTLGKRKMPICARCTGIMSAFPLGVIIGCFSVFSSRIYVAFFCIPLLLDAGMQYAGYHRSNNYLRLITGALAGFGCGIYLLLWLKADINYFMMF